MSGFEYFCGKTTSSESGLWITFKNAHSLKIKGKVKVKRGKIQAGNQRKGAWKQTECRIM
jgi:hypothetical protein